MNHKMRNVYGSIAVLPRYHMPVNDVRWVMIYKRPPSLHFVFVQRANLPDAVLIRLAHLYNVLSLQKIERKNNCKISKTEYHREENITKKQWRWFDGKWTWTVHSKFALINALIFDQLYWKAKLTTEMIFY